jgi:hypothetical protein
MVGGPGQRQSLREGSLQEAAKLLLARQQDREVIEAGRAWRPLLAVGQGAQAKDRSVAGAEDRLVFVAADLRQPELVVELRFAIEVEDLELGRAEGPVPRVQYQ